MARPNSSPSKQAQLDRKRVEAVLAGDDRAFQELMETYHKQLYYVVLKLVRNPADAEDLSQETFTKAYSSLKSYDSRFAFSTWLFRIGTNTAIDFLRKRKLNTLSIHTEPNKDSEARRPLDLEDTDWLPDEKLLRKQRRELLEQAVAELPQRYRELIRLRYMEEYSYEEVADELGLPMGTVKAQLHRGRELLNRVLRNSQSSM